MTTRHAVVAAKRERANDNNATRAQTDRQSVSQAITPQLKWRASFCKICSYCDTNDTEETLLSAPLPSVLLLLLRIIAGGRGSFLVVNALH